MAMLITVIATAAKAEVVSAIPTVTDVVSVTLSREGTLAEKILEQAPTLPSVTKLTVTGVINERDWECMVKQLPNLEVLDMSDATASFKEITTFNDNVRECSLPKGLTSIGSYAFDQCSRLQKISLSQGITSIGKGSFSSCQALQQISLPTGLASIGEKAFMQCRSLQQISLPTGLASIGEYAFFKCYSLQQISLPKGLTSIGKKAFSDCSSLQQISIPEGHTSIAEGVFAGCSSLQEVTLPGSLSSIGEGAFAGCSSLQEVTFPKSLSSIGVRAFHVCSSLQEVTLPESLSSIGSRAFDECTSLTKVTSLIPIPISTTGNIFSKNDIGKCTLVVPEWSAMLYKMALGWSDFARIETIKTGELSNITVTDTRSLPDAVRPGGTPNVNIQQTGSLSVRGESPLSMNEVTLGMSLNKGDPHMYFDPDLNNYITWYSTNQPGGVLFNDGSNLSARSAKIRLQSMGGIWAFISLPFDVRISDITNEPGKTSANFVFKRYDGERRGLVGSGGNWTEVTDILKAGVGYIYQSQDSASLLLPATPETVANICTKADVKTILNDYPSEDAEDAGWNFIGNPYPTYFDTRYIDFTAPITVWNGLGYDAVSLTDDEFVLFPYQAFFAQKQSDGNTLTFFAEGRLAENRESNNTSRVRAHLPSSADNGRKIHNIYLSDDGYVDKCRIVVNEQANAGYDASCDAVKFFSDNASLPQIYSIGANGTEYAINERPMGSGIIELGVRSAKGTYKIYSDTDNQIYLIDRKENKTIDLSTTTYEFASDILDLGGRFAISITGDLSSAIDTFVPSATDLSVNDNTLTIQCDESESIDIYTPAGLHTGHYTGSTNYTVTLAKGIYFVKTSHTVEKIIVK